MGHGRIAFISSRQHRKSFWNLSEMYAFPVSTDINSVIWNLQSVLLYQCNARAVIQYALWLTLWVLLSMLTQVTNARLVPTFRQSETTSTRWQILGRYQADGRYSQHLSLLRLLATRTFWTIELHVPPDYRWDELSGRQFMPISLVAVQHFKVPRWQTANQRQHLEEMGQGSQAAASK